MKAYLANSLFSEADQAYNELLARRLRDTFPWIHLYVPQENEELNDKQGYADSQSIFHGDNHYLDDADILIAVLDGAEIDSGVSAEIGRFCALKEWQESLEGQYHRSYVFGLYTDVRQLGTDNQHKIKALQADSVENQFFYRNLYTIGAIKTHGIVCSSIADLLINIQQQTVFDSRISK